MTIFIQRPDVEGADIDGILADRGVLNNANFPVAFSNLFGTALSSALPTVLPPLVSPLVDAGIKPTADKVVWRLLPTGVAATDTANVKATLVVIGAAGGGALSLANGTWNMTEKIVLPDRTWIVGDGSAFTSIRKDDSWTANDFLIDASGVVSGQNVTMRRNPGLAYLQLLGNAKAGGLLNLDYSQGGRFDRVAFSNCPNNTIRGRQLWDTVFFSCPTDRCGGVGAGNGVWRFLGSPPSTPYPTGDKTNMVTFVRAHNESYPDRALEVNDDGQGSSNGPYGIQFFSSKFESGLLVDNATVVDIADNCRVSFFGEMHLQFARTDGTSVSGIRGICGAFHIDDIVANIGAAVNVTSLVRAPAASRGYKYGQIVCGGDPTRLSMMVELPTSTTGIFERCAQIDKIVPFGSVPLLGGAGEPTTPITSQQLRGTLRRTLTTTTNSIQQADAGRMIEYNGTANGTLTVGRDNGGTPGVRVGAQGDEIIIDNISAFTLTVQSAGSTFQVAFADKTGGGGVIPAGGIRRLVKKRSGSTSGTDPNTAGVAIWYLI